MPSTVILDAFRKGESIELRKRKVTRINQLVEELHEARTNNPARAQEIQNIFDMISVELNGDSWRVAEVE